MAGGWQAVGRAGLLSLRSHIGCAEQKGQMLGGGGGSGRGRVEWDRHAGVTAGGRGRGRGSTLPAWMTARSEQARAEADHAKKSAEGPGNDGLPDSWRKVASKSRPGEFSFLHLPTGLKQKAVPTGEPSEAEIAAFVAAQGPARSSIQFQPGADGQRSGDGGMCFQQAILLPCAPCTFTELWWSLRQWQAQRPPQPVAARA